MKSVIRIVHILVFFAAAEVSAQQAPPAGFSSDRWWTPSQRRAQVAYEAALNAEPSGRSLRAFHDVLGSEPHLAGTPGDWRNINRLAVQLRMLGFEVQIHEFWAYLATPIDASLQIIGSSSGAAPIDLSLKEEVIPEDRYSKNPNLTIGFNAYSGNGDVTAEVVYANYGTKADFEKLKDLGVDVKGKIVLARYGGNFRGYKAKFAEEAGAAGLIIYTDPDDSGYRKGQPFPEGGWANETCIQRGSIETLDYPGDPLTPGYAATEHARRLDPATVKLPTIPVQPIGYGAAREIITRMKGTALPADQPDLIKAWQGGLPCAYRLTGGPDLKIHLMVKQERAITKAANVTATLWGQTQRQQKIIIGCHHDAWGYGAGDPLAGTILLLESAKSFSEANRAGHTLDRTIVFAFWDAEEYGIIGSTEYCEQNADDLMRTAVAYINLDAATMGAHFGSAASPSLKRIIDEVVADVPQAHNSDHKTVRQVWLGDRDEPDFGNLGGGSDHIAFYCHLGIPSCSLGADGGPGTAYHSNYDDLYWYRKVVGDDYEPAVMLTRAVNLLVSRLANASVLPLDPVQYGIDTRKHVEVIEKRAKELAENASRRPGGTSTPVEVSAIPSFDNLKQQCDRYQQLASGVTERLIAALADRANPIDSQRLQQINSILLELERVWLVPGNGPWAPPGGLEDRPWFRNLFAASDPDSGYAAWMLPALRLAVERNRPDSLTDAQRIYQAVLQHLTEKVSAIDALLRSP